MNEPIKKFFVLTAKLLKAVYNSKVAKFKLGEASPQRRIYFLDFMNSLKIVLSPLNQTCVFLMIYPSIEGE